MTNVRVKICGITNFADAQVALKAGADYLGFILYPKSPRYILPEQVRELRMAIENWRLTAPLPSPQSPIPNPQYIGVFVNETVERIAEILAFTGLDYAQLHGDEPPEFLPLIPCLLPPSRSRGSLPHPRAREALSSASGSGGSGQRKRRGPGCPR